MVLRLCRRWPFHSRRQGGDRKYRRVWHPSGTNPPKSEPSYSNLVEVVTGGTHQFSNLVEVVTGGTHRFSSECHNA